MTLAEPFLQVVLALGYYAALVVMARLAGKRHAGQTTTFDLIVLISLAVVLQGMTLRDGAANAGVFVLTVFLAHRGTALACLRWPAVRRLVRGAPRPLVQNGQVDGEALAKEGMSRADLLAGLRKLGFDRPEDVKLAALEETGQVSAVPFER